MVVNKAESVHSVMTTLLLQLLPFRRILNYEISIIDTGLNVNRGDICDSPILKNNICLQSQWESGEFIFFAGIGVKKRELFGKG
jgi:hypothetical protein